MTDWDPLDAPLPGLEQQHRDEGAVERAARQSIIALSRDVNLGSRHAVLTQALLTCARQLDRAATSEKAKDYGVANLLAQLRETYVALVDGKEESSGGDAWDELMAELRGGAPAVRDPAQP